MTPKPGAERPNWHLGRLDALRGLAILAVLLVHSRAGCQLPFLADELLYNGQRGVQLFFIASAFTLFLSNDNRRRAELHPTRNFFIRRFFRLAPVLYLVIALTRWIFPAISGSWRDVLLGIFFLHGISPTAQVHVAPGAWTLGDEALFYCSLPLLFRQIRFLRSAWIWLAVATPVCFLTSLLLTHQHRNLGGYFAFGWIGIEFPIFLSGVVLYFLWKERIRTGHFPAIWTPRTTSLTLLVLTACTVAANIPQTNRKLYISSAGCALFVLALLLHGWPLFVNRFTIFLGRISYSLYLLHAFVLDPIVAWAGRIPSLVAHPGERCTIQFLALLTVGGTISSLSWLYLEETGIRLGRRLIAHLEHRAAQRRSTQIPAAATTLLHEGNSADAQF